MGRIRKVLSACAPLAALSLLVAVPTAEGETQCYSQKVPLTVEEQRLTDTLPAGGPPVGPALIKAAGFDGLVADFTASLCATPSRLRDRIASARRDCLVQVESTAGAFERQGEGLSLDWSASAAGADRTVRRVGAG